MAEFPSHDLAAVRVLEVTLELDCSCGYVTVQQVSADRIGTGHSYTCKCNSTHWLTIPAA